MRVLFATISDRNFDLVLQPVRLTIKQGVCGAICLRAVCTPVIPWKEMLEQLFVYFS